VPARVRCVEDAERRAGRVRLQALHELPELERADEREGRHVSAQCGRRERAGMWRKGAGVRLERTGKGRKGAGEWRARGAGRVRGRARRQLQARKFGALSARTWYGDCWCPVGWRQVGRQQFAARYEQSVPEVGWPPAMNNLHGSSWYGSSSVTMGGISSSTNSVRIVATVILRRSLRLRHHVPQTTTRT
jgi:hypothetical protein